MKGVETPRQHALIGAKTRGATFLQVPERQGSTVKGVATPGEHTVEGGVTPWQHNEGCRNVGAAQ